MIEESYRLGTRADKIICAHSYTVNPDSVVLLHHPGNNHLRSHIVGMKAQNSTFPGIDQPCIMTYRKDRKSELAFPGSECWLELCRQHSVSRTDFLRVDPCRGICHPGSRQAYSVSPVRRSYA